jgi:co-chaperonin GroES (HSP10)
VGEGRWNASANRFNGFSCDVGDVVLFGEFAGFELSVDGRDFRVLRDVDVIGVFEGE